MLLPFYLLNTLTLTLYLILKQIYDGDILIIIPILQKRKLRHREVK